MTTTATKGTGPQKFRTEIRQLAQQRKRQRQQNERAVGRAQAEARRWNAGIAGEEKRRLIEDRKALREERKALKEEAKRLREEAKRLREEKETLKQRERRLRRNTRVRERRVEKKRITAEALAAEDLTPVFSKRAVKGMARKYIITPAGTYEPVQFLNAAGPGITGLLDEMRRRRARNVRMRLVCKMLQSNKNTGEDEVKHAGFPTENWKLYGSESAGGVWNKMREKMLESFSMYQKYGSG
jgi:hypothetical protein